MELTNIQVLKRTILPEHKVGSPLGSGGGLVGRAVASGIRDPRIESQHGQSFIYQLELNRNDQNKEKEAGNAPSKKKVGSPQEVS